MTNFITLAGGRYHFAGKMGNGLTLNGVTSRALGDDAGSLDITADWSIEAWIKPTTVSNGRTILSVVDPTTGEQDNELSIHFNSNSQLEVCSGGEADCTATTETFSANTWYHIAVTHDDSDDQIDMYVDNKRVVSNNGNTVFTSNPANAELQIGIGDEHSNGFFAGVIDEVRILDYQSMAFAGGLMITKVEGTNMVANGGTITVLNSGDNTINLEGLVLMKNSNGENGVQCADLEDLSSGSLTTGETLTASCDSLNNDAMVYLADRDGDNDDTNEGSLNSKEDVIDAVCWNDGSGTHLACDDTSDPIIAAGLWKKIIM